MTHEYELLQSWKRASNYVGCDWDGWYAVHAVTRDSDLLEQSNHAVILRSLEKLDKPDSDGESTVAETREGHWAYGWQDVLYVHSSNEAACEEAESLLASLQQYGCLDENDLGERQLDAAADRWENMSVRDRAQLLIDRSWHWLENGTMSLFSARRDELPSDPDGQLIDYLAY